MATKDWSGYDVCPACRVYAGERCHRWSNRFQAPWPAENPCRGRKLMFRRGSPLDVVSE
jgi:hypothetical protein